MRIALVTFEYPPDTAYGGIATYKAHAACMLRDRGHEVEVFSSSPTTASEHVIDGIRVHRVRETERTLFPKLIVPVFAECHQRHKFDVVEAPEYFADSAGIIEQITDVPVVVKLHTPSYLLWRITYGHIPFEAARNVISSLRRFQLPAWHPKHGPERKYARLADEVAAPCKSIADEVTRAWNLDPTRVAVVPNVYDPSPALLQIDPATLTNTVSFMGRLETRKGVLDLAAAIPLVLREQPDVKFRLVGRSVEYKPGLEMVDHLKHVLGTDAKSVEFTGGIPLHQMPDAFAATDICVFPSIWENFPNVCLESMCAARGVIGSRAGGMSEMIEDGKSGLHVSPNQPRELADVILRMIRNPQMRTKMGIAARKRVLSEFGRDRVGQLQEESYARAIDARKRAGVRIVAPKVTPAESMAAGALT